MKMKPEQLCAVLEANLARQHQWIGAAEARIPLLAALATAMLGTLSATLPDSATPWPWELSWAVAAAIPIAGAIACIAATSFPRTRSNRSSLLYFGAIEAMKPDEFTQKTNELTLQAYIEDLQAQCHRNAEIAKAKFAWVRRAQLSLLFATVPWTLALLSFQV